MAVITDITTGTTYASLSAAILGSGAGDTIDVPAGTYTEDFAAISHDLTIRGVGGMAHLTPAGSPSNGKAVFVINANVTLDHLEISGVIVPDANGAAVRLESGNLTLTNDWFHDNQEGLLAPARITDTITITNSEFDHNGAGDGFSHNIYVGDIALLSITNSYFHDAIIGHEIKSRAQATVITNSRIEDGPTSDASYDIDLPDGGAAQITGNVIEKGFDAVNSILIHYGGEGGPYPGSSLAITGNTIVDDRGNPSFLFNESGTVTAAVTGNTIFGIGPANLGNLLTQSGNSFQLLPGPPIDTSHPFLACFATGTAILTAHGEVPVETLQAGDLVATLAGGLAPIRWIGHRHIDCRRHPTPHDARPIRIRAGALAPGTPHRDLVLSPGHALWLAGCRIPVDRLVNGTTIHQLNTCHITYWHIETARHDVLFAEGAAAETYLDTGNRAAFANHPGHALAPHQPPTEAIPFAPLTTEGARLEAVRRSIAAAPPPASRSAA